VGGVTLIVFLLHSRGPYIRYRSYAVSARQGAPFEGELSQVAQPSYDSPAVPMRWPEVPDAPRVARATGAPVRVLQGRWVVGKGTH
jgi:hypothetical protein